MDWDQTAPRTLPRPEIPSTRHPHYSSPLSLASYRLILPHDVLTGPVLPMSSEKPRLHSCPTLPVELYRQIIQYITSNHDICSLARVSRAFQVEAERVLYHTLYLRHHIKTIWRCESLASQPRIALYVRKLSIILDQYTPLEPIARALRACSNLRHLCLRGAAWSDYSKVLDAVTSTDIQEFTCHARGEAGLVRFLERQPNLKELDFEAHGFDLENLSYRAARKLTTFTGWLATAATVVPGRPVKQLTLTSDMTWDATVRAVRRLSEAQEDVTVLDIRMGVLRNPMPWTILESVFTSLRGLRFLGVCSLDCAKHPSFPFYIMGLPHLQTLVFGTGTDDYAKYDQRMQSDVIHRLGQSSESLSQVIISLDIWKHDWIWTRDMTHNTGWNANWRDQGQEWWGTISNERVNLEELARLHVDGTP